MSGALGVMMGASGFPPVTNTYTTGTAATETVPAGASQVVITAWGPGGGGCRDVAGGNGSGGASGARVIKTIAVVGGNTFTYTIPAGGLGKTTTDGNGAAGAGATTVTGTVAGGSVSLSAGPGGGGNTLSGATGGTASGGDTNTAGNNSATATGLGMGAPGGGGDVGSHANGSVPGGGGAPAWVAASGGNGANGQISYAYT